MVRTLAFIVLAGALLACAAPAAAQTAAPPDAQAPARTRPYRGLFGGGVGNAEQLLTFSMSAGAGYDTNVLQGGFAGDVQIAGSSRVRGTFGVVSSGLNYSINMGRGRASWGGGASASFSYNTLVDRWINGEAANVGFSFAFTKRTTFGIHQDESFQPFYSLLPGDIAAAEPVGPTLVETDNGRILSDYHLMSSTIANLNHDVSRRTSVSLGYTYSQNTSRAHVRDYSTQTVATGLSFKVTRNVGFHVGARYFDSTYGRSDVHFNGYMVDAGLDFAKALSLSRRMTLSFSTGTAAIKDGDRTRYVATGSATLTREIGRSFQAALAYQRSVQFVAFFEQPVLTDTLSPTFSGSLSRRVNVHFGVGASFNQVGFRGSNHYRTYYANTGLSYGITRNLAVNADYMYNRYVFGSSIDLPSGVQDNVDRQSVRVFLSFWEPLYERKRRANVSR